jgi:hypothetical protein
MLIAAAVLAAAGGHDAFAKGTPVKGVVLGTRPVVAVTGDCTCETRWFTFGADAGKVQVLASMRKPGDQLSNEYAIRVMILRGSTMLGFKETLCFTSQKQCSGSLRWTLTMPRRGVYYMRVDGSGAHQIPFALQLKGTIFTLRCARSC